MTIITLAVDQDSFCVASDSYTTIDGDIYQKDRQKIFETSEIVFAGSGDTRAIALVKDVVLSGEWVPEDYNEGVCEAAESAKYRRVFKDAPLKMSGIVVEPKASKVLVHRINAGFFDEPYVLGHGEFDAIGCGAYYALGAMHAMYRPSFEAEMSALQGVISASQFNVFCGGSRQFVTRKFLTT